MIDDEVTLRHVIQRNIHVKFLGNTQSSKNIICPMRMGLQRDLLTNYRQQRFQFHIEGTLLRRITFGRLHISGIFLCFEELFPKQTGNRHTGHGCFLAVLTVAALRIFAKGDLHGRRKLDDHVINAVPIQLHGDEGAAQYVGRAGAGHSGGHAARNGFGKGLVAGIDSVNSTQLWGHGTGILVYVIALPAHTFLFHADMAMRVHKAGRDQAACRVQYRGISRCVYLFANSGDSTIVADQHIALHHFFDKVPKELGALLQGHSRIKAAEIDLSHPDYDTDVLIIGGGGAGASAAIEANNAGANVMIVTKLRIGDANTMMAEGGIQAADKPNDSPAIHFLDAFGGGHFAAKRELLSKLVCDAPEAIQWLNELGVEFDKAPDGTMITTHGGGTSRKRMHAAKDYSGAEIMRTLRDEVLNRGIPVVDFTAAIEIIKDENGNAAGAVLLNMETKELLIARAKTVIIATGGAGRLHYQGFPTSNHYGATADGLILAYRAGAKLLYADTLQYHPTGAAFPEQIFGALVTEKVRSLGAKLINVDGEAFMHPLETRDVSAASIIRECSTRGKGVSTGTGVGVWLDTPMIEMKGGEGTIEKRIPAMMRMFGKYGIDIRKEPILVYPTLHYQNGGIDITADCQSAVENLFVAGEAVGGIHGRNRLMGNSLLDIIVFGRNAGRNAANKSKQVNVGTLTLAHVDAFEKEAADAGIETEVVSPKLLPDYRRAK